MGPQAHIQWNRWIKIRPGIYLCLYDFMLGQPVEEFDRNSTRATFELDFTIYGKWAMEICPANGKRQGIVNEAGNSWIGFFRWDMKDELRALILPAGDLKGILVSVDAEVMHGLAGDSFSTPPTFISTLPQGNTFIEQASPIIPSIRMVIQQIFAPPVGRSMSRLYLESKAMELIALKLSHCYERPEVRNHKGLSLDDLKSIHRAKKLLVSDIINPPTIKILAMKAGINEYKLKSGFRKVFGDTVYRTLRSARMEAARKCFDRAEDNVLEVANQVGYANPGHFAAAFRESFGVTPSTYLSNRRRMIADLSEQSR